MIAITLGDAYEIIAFAKSHEHEGIPEDMCNVIMRLEHEADLLSDSVEREQESRSKRGFTCPFRVQGERLSFGEEKFRYNEVFVPCLEERCPCFCKNVRHGEYQCVRGDTAILRLGKIREDK